MSTTCVIICTLVICAAAIWITYIMFNRGIKITVKHVHETINGMHLNQAQEVLDKEYEQNKTPTQDDIAAKVGEIVRGILDED